MTLPSIMQFIQFYKKGPPEVMTLREGPLPCVKKNEVLIRVMAAGINRPDIAQRKGRYPPPPEANPVLGLEVAGEVVSLGHGVKRLKVGELVCALTNGGGYAEYCAVPEKQCLPWPENYSAVEAAALPENYFTVWANVFQLGKLNKNESLLVHGGSSGTGVTAIQLAHEFGAKVFATVGNAEKYQACVKLGAKAVINYREEDFAERIQNLTQQKGVDVILDIIGAAYFLRNINSLAMGGRLIQISTQQGALVKAFDLRQLMAKRLVITGSMLRPRTLYEKYKIAKALQKSVWPILDQGRCKPVIYEVFPLNAVQTAHKLMESSVHIGKLVLQISSF